ncbi:predicted protein [Sclerotinia sclerotiorum 1980 UF-70]|uniref:Uncharacterized protein n=1 Tax=Sclerotinia sclerotiorum (strain ATCC 18683 / 1980 / Ss-1) TaxID=665079 RepID=A7EVP9_SCLS1|nr:predicted protein [Sclerotinia sclerotiorum 1980 UF-70]EDN93541.1 predicted protein [Sclerotinia sclerotiorum 1980 UF-70]
MAEKLDINTLTKARASSAEKFHGGGYATRT